MLRSSISLRALASARTLKPIRMALDAKAKLASDSELKNDREGNLANIERSLRKAQNAETTKLESLVPFLATTSSAAPFIGLFGTVVGVMITFAAVAAAGEVNVNAIAPGIAAALLATVAGLGVAIPSLFGYNYLLTRIKVVTSDMHVFIDEFVTKLAEFYSEPER